MRAFPLLLLCVVLVVAAAAEARNTCGMYGLIGQCKYAAKLRCGSATKCCPKIQFGVDSNDPNMVVSHVPELQAAGAKFMVRYISQQATAPLAPNEARAWKGTGIKLVAVWEINRRRPVQGGSPKKNYALGRQDAHKAIWQMKQVGAVHKPVYFAVDSFVNPSKSTLARLAKTHSPEVIASMVIAHPSDVVPYFRGIRSVMNPKLVGAYGPYNIIKYLFDKGLIKWGWQASSFDSGKRVDPRIHLYQCSTLPPNVFGSSQLDYTFAVAPQYGQWVSTLK